jgi:hypothetical protein
LRSSLYLSGGAIVTATSFGLFSKIPPVLVLQIKIGHASVSGGPIAEILYLFATLVSSESSKACLDDYAILGLHVVGVPVTSPHDNALAAIVVPGHSAACLIQVDELLLGPAHATAAVPSRAIATTVLGEG